MAMSVKHFTLAQPYDSTSSRMWIIYAALTIVCAQVFGRGAHGISNITTLLMCIIRTIECDISVDDVHTNVTKPYTHVTNELQTTHTHTHTRPHNKEHGLDATCKWKRTRSSYLNLPLSPSLILCVAANVDYLNYWLNILSSRAQKVAKRKMVFTLSLSSLAVALRFCGVPLNRLENH